MRTEQFQECERIINEAKLKAAIRGAVGIIFLRTLQIKMLISLSKVFEVNLSKKVARKLLIKFYALSVLQQIVQIVGGVIAAVMAVRYTEYLGWAATSYFAKFGKQTQSEDFEPSKADPKLWQNLSQTNLDE